VTSAQQAIESAIAETGRLRKILRKSTTAQVWSDDEKQVAKATAHAYFNNHRTIIAAVLGEDHIKDLDAEYRGLIAASGRATTRLKYLDALKSIKGLLMRIQCDHVVALAAGRFLAPTSDVPPAFTPLVVDVRMQTILANRWLECSTCVDAGAPLAAVVMMGGLLEGHDRSGRFEFIVGFCSYFL
jgi:hypothetical protein